MNETIEELEKEIGRLMKEAPEEQLNVTLRKLEAIRSLCTEAEEAMSAGNYFEAYSKQKEMSEVLSDLRVILADQESKAEGSSRRTGMILGIFLVIAAIAGGFYYLWTPQPSGYRHGRGFSAAGKGKHPAEKKLDMLKKKISQVNEAFLKKLKNEEAHKKYTYSKSRSFKR